MHVTALLKRFDHGRLANLLDADCAGEERLLFGGISWERYRAIDNALGENLPTPRLYFLDDELEIMTTSLKHEELKERMTLLVDTYLLEREIEFFPHGQATMLAMEGLAGAQPDNSWCLRRQKEVPDIVLEVALTSGGLPKLEIYRRFKVREVWFWRKGGLEIYVLRSRQTRYVRVARSVCLPGLDFALLGRCLEIESTLKAIREFRAAIRAG